VAKVYVLFRFDTEDYVLPACDDVTKEIADVLYRNGVRATFITVGELARTWERRGRTDVIESLRRHSIGYHTNYHSKHPVPPEYCEGLTWEEGVAEIIRREGSGVRDLRRIFGQNPACYVQGGGAWTPTYMGAMREWGLPSFWEAGSWHSFVSYHDQPFWYCGVLIFDAHVRLGNPLCLSEKPEAMDNLKKSFAQAYEKLHPSGGICSPGAHPNNLNTTESWDGVDYRWGENIPRTSWRMPKRKPAKVVRANFKGLDAIAKYMRAFPDTEFIGCDTALGLFPDLAQGAVYEPKALTKLAQAVQDEVTFYPGPVANSYITASEAYWLLLGLLAEYLWEGEVKAQKLVRTPLGPSLRVTTKIRAKALPGPAVLQAAAEAFEYVTEFDQLPNSVVVEHEQVTLADFFVAVAHVAEQLLRKGTVPDEVPYRRANYTLEQYDTSEKVEFGWAIFRRGWRADHLIELARLHLWSLKPAVYQP